MRGTLEDTQHRKKDLLQKVSGAGCAECMISFKNHRGQEAEMKNIKYLVTVFFGSAIVALLIGQSFG
ncbi:MAG TPA: hypothetical protein VFF31_08445, partial [Blastocatellia bacterium]|nr:hypothetical protein [Blastocatellia bacterium]